jgi:AN1-type zinc finger protein 5/6
VESVAESVTVEKREPLVEVQEPPREEKEEEKQVDRKRCFTCKKKVGLLGNECKCKFVFCNAHRLPEEHCCNFNFKE